MLVDSSDPHSAAIHMTLIQHIYLREKKNELCMGTLTITACALLQVGVV